MRRVSFFVAVVGIMLAGMILGVSVWRQAEEQAYAVVVPENIQKIMDAQNMSDKTGVARGGSEMILPGKWNYYPIVAWNRLRLLMVKDERDEFDMLIDLAGERREMAEELLEINKYTLAVKTVNKAKHYLDKAVNIIEESDIESQDATYMWRLVCEEANHQEVILMIMKGEVHDLAGPAVDTLCEEIRVVSNDAERHLEIKGD